MLPLHPVFPPAPLPLPQPFSIPENRVNYNDRLLEGFNFTHQNRRNRRSNRRFAIAQPASAQPGPAQAPPAVPNIQPYQHIIDFQHDAAHERQQQAFH